MSAPVCRFCLAFMDKVSTQHVGSSEKWLWVLTRCTAQYKCPHHDTFALVDLPCTKECWHVLKGVYP